MGSGDPPGLQNRRTASFGVVGGFDSHSLPPNLNLRCSQRLCWWAGIIRLPCLDAVQLHV
jgi:hypothetical protein